MANKKQWRPRHYPSHCITIQNGNRLVAEGVRDVRLCSSEKMLLVASEQVEIKGSGLRMNQLGNGTVEVRGRIAEIRLGWQE